MHWYDKVVRSLRYLNFAWNTEKYYEIMDVSIILIIFDMLSLK